MLRAGADKKPPVKPGAKYKSPHETPGADKKPPGQTWGLNKEQEEENGRWIPAPALDAGRG